MSGRIELVDRAVEEGGNSPLIPTDLVIDGQKIDALIEEGGITVEGIGDPDDVIRVTVTFFPSSFEIRPAYRGEFE